MALKSFCMYDIYLSASMTSISSAASNRSFSIDCAGAFLGTEA